MATTGTKSGTGDFTGLNDILKHTYTEAFDNNVEKESEVSDIFQKAEGFQVHEGPDGKQINLSHVFSSGGGVGAMNEDDYLYTPTSPTAKQSYITIKQLSATVELSGRVLRRVKEGPAAFITWANEALPRRAQRLAYHKDRMYLGTGTGIIARYNGSPDGTGDGIDSAFGIAGLEGACNLILRDDNLRAGPNADGSSLRSGTALVTGINYDLSQINTSVAGSPGAPSSAADNDYLFLGDDNVNGSGARELMGMEGIIDDGTNLATFQGLSRSTYPEMNGQVIDSTANGYDGTLNEELLDFAAARCYERGNLGMPSIILVNRTAQRAFWKTLKDDRVLNDPAGVYTGGKAKLRMILGNKVVEVRAARKVPSSRCYGIDPSTMHRFKIGTGRWDDTDGSVWNRVVNGTGRKDAFYAVYIEEEEVACSDPAKNFKLTNLAAA